MTTVSPIMGGRLESIVTEYEDLVKASYEVIEQTGVILTDRHKAISEKCEGLSKRCPYAGISFSYNQRNRRENAPEYDKG